MNRKVYKGNKVYNTMKRISKTSKTQVVIDLNNISPAKVEE